MELFTIEELALKIRKSHQSIYNDLKRNPQSLPPRVMLPGTRRVLFSDVDTWIKSHTEYYSPTKQIKAPRGRPTKAQELTRQPRVEHASNPIKNPPAAKLTGLLCYI